MARGITIDSREALVDAQVEELCENFDDYLDEFNDYPPFKGSARHLHIKTIDLRYNLRSAAESIDSDEYMRYLYDTLDAWGMDIRGAERQEYDIFAESVCKYKDDIADLEDERVAQIDAGIARELWQIIQGMKLSNGMRKRTFTGANALHHLLPRLLPPIDREYTWRFFHYGSSHIPNEKAFSLMLCYFKRIAQEVNLRRYVDTARWATSESKVIDNAIIGYCLKHPDMPVGLKDAGEWWQRRFT